MIRFILETLKPFKIWIIGQATVGIIWAIDLSLRPYILKTIIDKIPRLTSSEVVQALSLPMMCYLAMSLLIVIAFRVYDFVWLKFNPCLKRHVGNILMQKMMDHSLVVFQNHFSGDLANKIKDVMSGIPDLVKVSIHRFFSDILALIIATFAVWTISYKFSILLLAWVLIFIVGSIFFAKRAKKLCAVSSKMRSKVVGHMVDILSNIINVHLFAAKKVESNLLLTQLNHYVAADQKRDWWFLKMFAFQGLSFVIYQAVGFWFLLNDFKANLVTAGDFALLISVNIAIVDCLWSLSGDILTFSEVVGNIEQGLQVALASLDIMDKPNALTLQVKHGVIKFDSVKFYYHNAEPLFQNKSITIAAGQKVGLVGYSGSGKTTFINLILRLYEIVGGKITIDDQDIKDVTQDSLHSNIAMIPQDPTLFHRSLIENIRYGKIDATDSEVIEAAKKAHAHEFISNLPQGYHSLVGERGIKLSGGQRQRIAIARAILKNAPILILDEATSQLDSVTESDIQESLWQLMQGKTTIIIAHRLSTLLQMDRILVFDRGKIVEDGSHQELLAYDSLYKFMWNKQIGGFLPDKITS